MSYREKSAWICSVAIVLVYGFSGLLLLRTPLAPTRVGVVVLLVVSTILMIVITAIGHIAVIVGRRLERPDERDDLIAVRSTRIAYYSLSVGVWGLLFLALAWPQPALMAYTALGVLVLAELVRLASQVVMYRLGA